MKNLKNLNKIKFKGFTLIEVLLVVAIIGILTAIVFIAINPALAYAKANDAQRYSDIKTLDSAILQYIVDKDHAPYIMDNCSPEYPSRDCYTNETPGAPYSWLNLMVDLNDYISSIPRDPCGIECFKESTPYTSSKFFTYAYYSPSAYYNACINEGNCGVFPDMTPEQARTMYSVYAEHLEAVDMAYGLYRNQFQSY